MVTHRWTRSRTRWSLRRQNAYTSQRETAADLTPHTPRSARSLKHPSVHTCRGRLTHLPCCKLPPPAAALPSPVTVIISLSGAVCWRFVRLIRWMSEWQVELWSHRASGAFCKRAFECVCASTDTGLGGGISVPVRGCMSLVFSSLLRQVGGMLNRRGTAIFAQDKVVIWI